MIGEKFNVCGVYVSNYNKHELAEKLIQDFKKRGEKKPKLVFSLNGESLSKFNSDKTFSKKLSKADIIHPDGQSIVSFGNMLNGKVFKERVATTDFFHDAALISQVNNLSFYMIGASDSENLKCIDNIIKQYPKLNIVGSRNGYFEENDYQDIVEDINKKKADVVWLALGRPKQEEFAIYLKERLSHTTWIKTCGGVFNFLSKTNRRAPLLMQSFGLEWLYRLILEPKRLFYRYLITNIHCIFLLFKYLTKK